MLPELIKHHGAAALLGIVAGFKTRWRVNSSKLLEEPEAQEEAGWLVVSLLDFKGPYAPRIKLELYRKQRQTRQSLGASHVQQHSRCTN